MLHIYIYIIEKHLYFRAEMKTKAETDSPIGHVALVCFELWTEQYTCFRLGLKKNHLIQNLLKSRVEVLLKATSIVTSNFHVLLWV